jgi:tRNA(fMet)-specific endonuclease VapC
MTPRYLLDTNICIYVHRQRPPEVLARFDRLRPGEAAISVVTYGELVFGAEKSARRAKALRVIEEFGSLLHVLPLSREIAKIYGALRALLESRGEIIGGNDLWIAAHAQSAGMTLVTNNEREFRRVPRLRVENWVS